ncbi:MAG TPA: SDR family oxidoreductase [Acidimicrobiales bacterium]|nr:SDR family oxidoreductase [Acidimicrobiales bacterium]
MNAGPAGGGGRRAVLVTGASRGIGAATARAFAALGDRVALHCSSAPDLAEAVRAGLPGDGHLVVRADLADAAAVAAMVEEATSGLGGLDVVVNNAGVYLPHPVLETTYEQWQAAWAATLGVNLVGPANVVFCAARHLGPGGRIVNVGSRGAWRGEPDHPAYGASKAALVALGQSMAKALGPRGIAVTTVAPGWVTTDMAAEWLAGPEGAARLAEGPLGRAASPEEVAAAIVFLASPQAEYATGAVLDLNGGSYLRM